MKSKTPPRLIDLHTDWILQYAQEATVFDPALYPGVLGRLGNRKVTCRGPWVAILSCYRKAEDWASQADPWEHSASCSRGSRRNFRAGC